MKRKILLAACLATLSLNAETQDQRFLPPLQDFRGNTIAKDFYSKGPLLALLTANENDPVLRKLPELLNGAVADLKTRILENIPELEKLGAFQSAAPKPPVLIIFDARNLIQEKFTEEAQKITEKGLLPLGRRLRGAVRQVLSPLITPAAERATEKQIQSALTQKGGEVETELLSLLKGYNVKLVPLFTNPEDYDVSMDRGIPTLNFRSSNSPSTLLQSRLGGDPFGVSRVLLISNDEKRGVYWDLSGDKAASVAKSIVQNYVDWRYPHVLESVDQVPSLRYAVSKLGEIASNIQGLQTVTAHTLGLEPLTPVETASMLMFPSTVVSTGAIKLTAAFNRELSSGGTSPVEENGIPPTTDAEKEAIQKQWQVLLSHEVLDRSGSEDLKKQIGRVHAERMKLFKSEGLSGHNSLISLGRYLDEISKETKKYIDTYGSSTLVSLGLSGYPKKVMNFIFEASSGARLYLERKAKRLGVSDFRKMMDDYISNKSARPNFRFPKEMSADDLELFKASVEIVEALGVMAGYYASTVTKEMLRFDKLAAKSLTTSWPRSAMYKPIVQAIYDIENTDKLNPAEPAGRPHFAQTEDAQTTHAE